MKHRYNNVFPGTTRKCAGPRTTVIESTCIHSFIDDITIIICDIGSYNSGLALVPQVLSEVGLVQHRVGQLVELLRDVRRLGRDAEP